MSGRLITIEGGEGAGKSSCLSTVCNTLAEHGITPLMGREPGGTPVGESIRNLLLDPDNKAMTAQTELLLMFASRSQLVDELIRPGLRDGRWIVSDRYTDASFAYQGGGRGIDAGWIELLAHKIQAECIPDMTILLDIDPEIGMARALKDRQADRMESEKLAFYQAVRQVYLQRANAEPQRFKVIDASQSQVKVLEDVRETMISFIRQVRDAG